MATRHQLKFLIISHELNPGEQFRSCEPLCYFFHPCYNYKCMYFKLNIKWHNHGKIGCFLLQKHIPILDYFNNK